MTNTHLLRKKRQKDLFSLKFFKKMFYFYGHIKFFIERHVFFILVYFKFKRLIFDLFLRLKTKEKGTVRAS